MIFWLLTSYRAIIFTTLWPALCLGIVGPLIVLLLLGRSGRKSAADLNDFDVNEGVHLTIAGICTAVATLHIAILILGSLDSVFLVRSYTNITAGPSVWMFGPAGYDHARLLFAGGILLFTAAITFAITKEQLRDTGAIREFIDALRDPPRRRQDVGSAAFCTPRQFRRYRRPDPEGLLFLGKFWTLLPGLRQPRRLDATGVMYLPGEDTTRGILTLGNAGSGKTQSVIKPTIFEVMDAGRPVIVVDPQGELLPDVLSLAPLTGHTVIVHDPTSLEHPRFNLAADLHTVSDARAIANVLIESLSGDNRFWSDSAAALLAACLLRYQSLGEIYQALANLKSLANKLSEKQDDAYLLANAFIASIQADGKVATNTVATLSSELQGWADANVRANTSATDFQALDLMSEEKPLALIITCPGRQRDIFARYLGAVLSRLFLDLDTIGEAHGGPLPVPVTFVIDEFPTLGRLDRLVADINLIRKRRISIMLAAQSIGQLDMIYGREGAQSLMAGLAMQIVFGATDQATAEYVSRISGTATVRDSRTNDTSGQLRQRALLTSDEVQSPLRGNSFIITRYVEAGYAAQTVMFAQLTRYYERQDIQQRMAEAQAVGLTATVRIRPPSLKEHLPPVAIHPDPALPNAAVPTEGGRSRGRPARSSSVSEWESSVEQ